VPPGEIDVAFLLAARGRKTMSESDDLVLREVASGACTLTLNRPERKNAWAPDLEQRYSERLAEADTDAEVRVIVVTGSGTTFCPSVDTQRLSALSGAETPRLAIDERLAMTFPLSIRRPMIAAINDSATGVGLMQTLNCDVRFPPLDDSSRIPGDMGY